VAFWSGPDGIDFYSYSIFLESFPASATMCLINKASFAATLIFSSTAKTLAFSVDCRLRSVPTRKCGYLPPCPAACLADLKRRMFDQLHSSIATD
jgi:hypothetical protein